MLPPRAEPAAPQSPWLPAVFSRPAVVALMLVLIFLAAGSDVESPERQLLRTSGPHAPPPPARQEVIKEQIILDLSLANDALAETNRRLRIEYLALRRAARAAGLLNVTNATLLGLPPASLGLTDEGEASGSEEGGGGGAGAEAGERLPAAQQAAQQAPRKAGRGG